MATLEDKNLTVSREFEFSNDVPSGQVIRQDPKAGKTVKEGTKVTIYVSQGTESLKVTDVRGKPRRTAKAHFLILMYNNYRTTVILLLRAMSSVRVFPVDSMQKKVLRLPS